MESVVVVVEFGEMSPVERAAHLTMRLVRGEEVTARQVATQYGVSRQTAYRILDRTCRVIPLANEDGVWRVLPESCRPG